MNDSKETKDKGNVRGSLSLHVSETALCGD
jgi:hypothetical protein